MGIEIYNENQNKTIGHNLFDPTTPSICSYHLRIHQSAAYWHPSHAPQSEWMYRRDEGGGYLMGLQSHDIDFALTVLGEPEAIAADVKTTVARRRLTDGEKDEGEPASPGTGHRYPLAADRGWTHH